MVCAMNVADAPNVIVWDVTFACPLRCSHCYTESGRRAPQNLTLDEMLRVADAILAFQPELITLCGGEPLTVPRIMEVAERFANAGVKVFLYTSGWRMQAKLVSELAKVLYKIVVSVDGATAEVHDNIRGRASSFDRAMKSLALIDEEVGRTNGPLLFGIDTVVVRSNFHQLEEMCTRVAPRFPHLDSLSLGAAVPTGLASRPSFVDAELLSDAQVSELIATETVDRLRKAAPRSVRVDTTDNFEVQMNPDFIASNPNFRPLEIEPDGEVRGMPIYEGTVGSLLTEDPFVLWQRSRERWQDPFVLDCLARIHTRRDWADAVRRIDNRFGSPEVRARIAARPEYMTAPA